MKKHIYRFICILSLLTITATALGCTDKAADSSASEENPDTSSLDSLQEALTPHVSLPQAIIFEPIHTTLTVKASEPPFSLPSFDLDYKSSYYPIGNNTNYHYKDVSAQMIGDYVKKLEGEGVSSVIYADKTAMLYRDDCVLTFSGYDLENKNADITMKYYVRSEHTPKGAISATDATDLISNKYTGAMKTAFPPIDITPEGFYEASGLQIFAQPEHYSPQGNYHQIQLYLVYRGIDARNGYCNAAMADIDKNGKHETWIVEYGGTSGIYTFNLIAYEGDTIKYTQRFMSSVLHPKFAVAEGTLTLDFPLIIDKKISNTYVSYSIAIDETGIISLKPRSTEAEREHISAYPPKENNN